MSFLKQKFLKVAVVLMAFSIVLFGCAKDNDIALKINEEVITHGQFYQDFDKAKKERFSQEPEKIKKDNSYAMLSFKEQYVSRLITKTLLQQEFIKRGIEASQEEVEQRKQMIIQQAGSEEQLLNSLKEHGVSMEKFMEDMQFEVKIDKLIKALGEVKISDDEALKFYNKNKAMFSVPEQVKVSHILIDASPENLKKNIVEADKEILYSTSEIDKKVQEEILKKEAFAKEIQQKAAKNPKLFGALAKQYSNDEATKDKGGDLGYVPQQALDKDFAEAAFSQKIGVVGNVVKTQFGYHIILVTDRTKEGIQPFDVVKNDLKQYLSQMKSDEKFQEYIKGLKDTAKIEYMDKSLDPDAIKKQLEEVLKKQIEKASGEESKQRALEK
ncbi:peptidylprolyl isomerase [bacterium]|nr:peptidylprolyl isomerase [bacterium]